MSGITVFASVLLSVCIAEMGDKTQLLVVGFAAKHSSRDI
ncbi:MAG: TMEM165/GDT1 family protein, partial [Clostridia bacterium]